jgi:hypothetical protein
VAAGCANPAVLNAIPHPIIDVAARTARRFENFI